MDVGAAGDLGKAGRLAVFGQDLEIAELGDREVEDLPFVEAAGVDQGEQAEADLHEAIGGGWRLIELT
ncbi:MAG TPA: hypothetical protein VJP07_02315 [Dehalococcoidia bacterium]|nr:hypothetical protein [Dehalococcoidia bacterium]